MSLRARQNGGGTVRKGGGRGNGNGSPGGRGNNGGGGTTWNSADKDSDITLSGSNLVASMLGGTTGKVRTTTSKTVGADSNIYQVEILIGGGGGGIYPYIGLAQAGAPVTTEPGFDATSWAWSGAGAHTRNNNAIVDFISGCTIGDYVGLTFNLSTGALKWYKNGVLQATFGASNSLTGTWFVTVGSQSANPVNVNYTLNATGPFVHTVGGATAWG